MSASWSARALASFGKRQSAWSSTSRKGYGITADIPKRVTATTAALAFIAEIQEDHPDILFHQSGGCCDGSAPMCYPTSDFKLGQRDVELGQVGGVPVYIGAAQFEVWQHTQLIIDVVPGQGGMFSLDNGREKRFLTRSKLFTDDELEALNNAASPARSSE